MSDRAADEELVSRLRHMNAETEKFIAEQRKLIAEAQELTWDRWMASALAIAAVIGGLLGVASFMARVIH